VWYLARMWCARLIIIVMTLGAARCSAATQPVGRIGISIDDARLAAAVRTAIVNDPDLGLREIVIEARSGTVILSGQVNSDEEAHRASTLAGTIAGVRNVKSTLRVARDS
jgi:osmotically-inducible protein OsmY